MKDTKSEFSSLHFHMCPRVISFLSFESCFSFSRMDKYYSIFPVRRLGKQSQVYFFHSESHYCKCFTDLNTEQENRTKMIYTISLDIFPS